MTTSLTGIKSLTARVENLESITQNTSSSQQTSTGSFAEQLISNTTNTLKTDLQTVFTNYEQGLQNLGINTSNFKLVDLIKAVPYTITYVENNASVIADILKKDVTSGFKLQTALTFLKQYFQQEEKFLIGYIEQAVDLLFNQAKNTSAIIPNSTQKVATISKANSKRLFKKSSS